MGKISEMTSATHIQGNELVELSIPQGTSPETYVTRKTTIRELLGVSLGPLKVEDRDLAVLPSSPVPAAGTAYIVAAGSPQSYATNTIAIADGSGGWYTITPEIGDEVFVKDEATKVTYGTASPLAWG